MDERSTFYRTFWAGSSLAVPDVVTQTLLVFRREVIDAAGALHLMADSARHRGDEDFASGLRLVARHLESLQVLVERTIEGDGDEKNG